MYKAYVWWWWLCPMSTQVKLNEKQESFFNHDFCIQSKLKMAL